VHCSEAVLAFALGIDPVLQELPVNLIVVVWIVLELVSISILENMLTKNLDGLCRILKCSEVERVEPLAVVQLGNVQICHSRVCGSCLTSLGEVVLLRKALQKGL
jgi:hypothetical protein